MLVFLSDQYEGKEIEKQYCYEVVKKQVLKKNFSLNLSRNHYEAYQQFPANSEEKKRNVIKDLLNSLKNSV